MMNTLQIVVVVTVAVFALASLIAGLVHLIIAVVKRIDHSKGGWRRLVEVYATENPPGAQVTKRETLKIGAIVYKRCVTLGVSNEGLHVTIWRKSVLIPWDHFTKMEWATLYWKKVPMLTVGDPPVATITVPTSALDLIRSRLPAALEVSRTRTVETVSSLSR